MLDNSQGTVLLQLDKDKEALWKMIPGCYLNIRDYLPDRIFLIQLYIHFKLFF